MRKSSVNGLEVCGHHFCEVVVNMFFCEDLITVEAANVILSKYRGEISRDTAVPGHLLSVVGPSVSFVGLFGGLHMLRKTYVKFAGSGYRKKLVE